MTELQAIEIARRTAEEMGWGWLEPVEATLRRPLLRKRPRLWEVTTNVLRKGGNVRMVIDDETGQVIEKHYARY